jgi:subtilisin family serine protease
VKLLSGKFLGANGGTIANAIKAVDYFTNLKKKGLNIVATNNSWGGGGYSTALYDAIERANDAGILFIAAAGNTAGQNNDVNPSYPSSYNNANVIAVASITSSGGLSSFSQFGPTSVDIGAPGSDIWSTVPGSYNSYSGTSMATPHVTGAAALYKAINPTATAAQIKAAILNGATPTASLAGKVVSGGRLNVVGFLTPSAPTTSSPSKTPTPPPTKTPTSPTPPPTPSPTATCLSRNQPCKKTNCGLSCCCPGLTCRGSASTCR